MKVDTGSSEDVYFVAPDKYLGDQRFAYSFTLSFHLQQDDASSPASSSKGDVILEGKWFDEPLVTSLANPPPGGDNFNKYEVRIRLNSKKQSSSGLSSPVALMSRNEGSVTSLTKRLRSIYLWELYWPNS